MFLKGLCFLQSDCLKLSASVNFLSYNCLKELLAFLGSLSGQVAVLVLDCRPPPSVFSFLSPLQCCSNSFCIFKMFLLQELEILVNLTINYFEYISFVFASFQFVVFTSLAIHIDLFRNY